jgi:putative addiction module killer protein
MEPSTAIEVLQYETAEGICPFEQWFNALDARAAAKVRTAVARIETGNLGDVTPVGAGVSERRIDFGPGYRVYFGQDGPRMVLLLVGGTKKRQQRDIDLAKAYWQDYKRRKQAG